MKIFNFITKQCLTLLCTAFITTQANASVCFLPDADNCGTNDIVTQCDGIRYFTKTGSVTCEKIKHPKSQTCVSAGDCDELKCIYSGQSECESEADRLSYKYRHYECELDESVGCWQLKWTDCSENTYYSGCSGYNLTSPEDGKACDSCSQTVTNNLCTNKGISYTEYDTRTVYDCVPIRTDVRGCSGYNLNAELTDYDCDSCTPDVYKTDYSGNYNYSGKGNTVYSCSKTAGCSGYDLTASDKATKEASGDYRCHECTPTVTDSDGNTSSGTTVYKCGKITTSTTTCPSNYISAAEADELKKDTCYSCTGCTPTTDYYEDGVWYNGTSGTTVYNCSKPDCTNKSKASDCGTGKEFVAAGDCAKFANGEPCGSCIDCNDETNPINKCFGKYTCKENGRHGVGAVTCTCGNVPYYDRCEVEETCKTNSDSKWYSSMSEWGYCYATTNKKETETRGHYYLGDKCKKVDLTQVYSYAICNGVDCNGNKGEAYGLKTCPNNEGAEGATTKECGGYKYFSACRETCNTNSDSKWYSSMSEWGYCYATTNKKETETRGHYYLGDKCEKVDGTKVYYYAICNGVDCNGNKGEAYGLKTCPNDEGAEGATTKECGGYKYFSACRETCNTNSDSKGYSSMSEWGYCYATTNKKETETRGHYYLGDKCEKVDGTKVYYYAICNGVDCNGNKGEAYGLKMCASGLHPSGTTKQCGGETYAERCLTECNYEDDAKSCADKGKNFVAKCHDENDKEWGECKDKE